MTKKISPEQQAFLGLWRKAHRDGGLRLPLPTKSDAVRMRFALYNAMRPIRTGDLVDKALLDASEGILVRVEEENGKAFVAMIPKSSSALMAAALEALGGEVVEAPPTKEEAELKGVMERIAAIGAEGEAGENPAPVRTTPYYTRER